MNTFKGAIGLLLVGSFLFSSCSLKKMISQAEKQELTVKPSPLELHGDSVVFTMAANLPTKMLRKGTNYTVKSTYKPTDSEMLEVGSLEFKSDDFPDANEKQPRLEQRFSFAYEDRLGRGQIYVQGTAEKNGVTKSTPEIAVPNGGMGVITTSRLGQPTFYANYVPHGYVDKEEYEPQNMEFFFSKGRSNLRRGERRGEEGKKLQEYIDAKAPTRTVTITGMHSPEGATSINSKLANERPKAVEEYYKMLMKKSSYTDAEGKINFVNKPVVESWTAFKELLNDSDKLKDNERNEILSIINGPGNFVSKELKLQRLSSYRKLIRYIYPPLRAAKAEILKIKPRLTEAEIMVLAQKISKGEEEASKLRADQIAYAAHKTPDLAEKEMIYQSAIKEYDANYSYNNLGAVYLEMAKKQATEEKKMEYIDKAITQFELSIKRKATAEAYANLAGAQLMKGENEASKESLAKASGSAGASVGQTVNALKGYASIFEGNYDAAIQALSSAGNDPVVLYNKALAYLLKASWSMSDDYSKAESAFKEAIEADSNNAYAHYGAAITAARMKNGAKMVEHLKEAVKDKKLKERAVKDLEFMAYFSDSGFMGLMK